MIFLYNPSVTTSSRHLPLHKGGMGKCGLSATSLLLICKYYCFIINSEGEVLYDVFTIQNNIDGFNDLRFKIKAVEPNPDKVKAGLEATGHYSCNILGFLKNVGIETIVINPLFTSLSRKSISLRKTKTDKVDARTIASMIMSDVSLKPYSDKLYHNEDLKSLTRYRFFLVFFAGLAGSAKISSDDEEKISSF